jgi:hypothetical protein
LDAFTSCSSRTFCTQHVSAFHTVFIVCVKVENRVKIAMVQTQLQCCASTGLQFGQGLGTLWNEIFCLHTWLSFHLRVGSCAHM